MDGAGGTFSQPHPEFFDFRGGGVEQELQKWWQE